MYEYELRHKVTGETTFLWGYSWSDLEERNPNFDFDSYTCINSEYID